MFRDELELIDLGAWLEGYADTKSGGMQEIRLENCPKCGNDEYKLYVNTEKLVWICYVCDWGRGLGDAVQLMAEVSGRSLTDIRLELTKLVPPAPKGDITEKLEEAFDGEEPESIFEDLEEIEVPGAESFGGLTTRRVLDYALERGLSLGELQKLKLRAAMSLMVRKNTPEPKSIRGPFLIFPVRCAGKVVSWQGRRVYNQDPKYVSASNVKDWLWPLDETFFNVYKGRVALVEGVFDALGFIKMGVAALCTFGKSISDAQLTLLRELQPEELLFAWDLDATNEVLRAVDRVAYTFPRTSVISFKREDGVKVDPGDTLNDQKLSLWLQGQLGNSMDVRSPEFFQWRMENT